MTQSSSDEADRRQSFRLDMEKELVDIFWLDEQGKKHTKKIACLDFSRGGLKLDCDQALPLQANVTIVFKSSNTCTQKLNGKVLRCNKQENGWYEIALIMDRND